jgi:hypothetical protein
MTDGTTNLTAELIVDGAVPRNPVISPDGRWVAYAVVQPGGRGGLAAGLDAPGEDVACGGGLAEQGGEVLAEH